MTFETLTPDDETEIRWYFCEARGDCGLRSAMGGQIAAIEANAMVDRKIPALGQSTMYVRKESGGRTNTAEDAMARICDSGKPERASKVAAKLRLLPPCHQATLEAQYSMTTEIDGAGVSPLLVSNQPLAKETYREYKIRKTRKKKNQKSDELMTPMMWVNHLAVKATEKADGEQARIFGTMIVQARAALAEACAGYNRGAA